MGLRRLALVDVGAKTEVFGDPGRGVWSVANAEIYNADELRAQLAVQGVRFSSRVDTEVLPFLWQAHGPDMLDALNGMFAFAIWDEHSQTLMLARDRAGEKPLYYWYDTHQLAFASELRALLTYPGISNAIDPVALNRYLLHGFFPAPRSPFKDIRKLPAGHYLIARQGKITQHRYWDLKQFFCNIRPGNVQSQARELDERLSLAVARRRRGDLNVGLFLSGGIDSSAVLAHLTEQLGSGVPVFSLGHTDRDFDESSYAEKTARHFKAEFHELVLDEDDLKHGLELVTRGFDEPLADASIIPTHLLSLFAKQKVKVVLSGEGADELFAGYPTYIGHRVASVFGRIPRPLRALALKAIGAVAPASMGNVGIDYLFQKFVQACDRELVERHHVWFGILDPYADDSVLSPTLRGALTGDDAFRSARKRLNGNMLPDSIAKLLYTDFTMYLQDDLLTKVDRATMLASLEARAPFLDHELCEFAAGLPSKRKIKGITTKSILRRALRHRLPKEVLSRRKRGFNIPFSKWMLHGLGDEMKRRFSRERVLARGLFSPKPIKAMIEQHLARRRDHRKPLFALLILDLWCDTMFGEGVAVPMSDLKAVS